MTTAMVIDLTRDTVLTTFWLSLPLLAVGFLVGIAISFVQIVTSIQDMTFATVPKLIALSAALVVALPWMCGRLVHYTAALWGDFARYAH